MNAGSVCCLEFPIVGEVHTDYRCDADCRALAIEFLTALVGSAPDALWWDVDFQLQGHVRVQDCEFILIAPRDAAHQPVVLTRPDWEQIRKAVGDERRDLLASYAITDRHRLAAVLTRTHPVRTAV